LGRDSFIKDIPPMTDMFAQRAIGRLRYRASERQLHELSHAMANQLLWIQTATPKSPQSRCCVYQTAQGETPVPEERGASSYSHDYLE
jgi:hypothetical protein